MRCWHRIMRSKSARVFPSSGGGSMLSSQMLLLACWYVLLSSGGGSHLKTVESKRLFLRPLNASEVYRILRAAGREDVLPQGRFITNGIAAATGWALGFTKAMAGVFIYDVITANVTADMLTEAEAEGSVANGANGAAGNRIVYQEVCFNSRQARSLEEAEAVATAHTHHRSQVHNGDKQQQQPRKAALVRKSNAPRRHKRRRRNKQSARPPPLRRHPQRIRNKAIMGTTAGIGTRPDGGTLSGTGTLTAQPTTTAQRRIWTAALPTGTTSADDFGSGRDDDFEDDTSKAITNDAGISITSGADAPTTDTYTTRMKRVRAVQRAQSEDDGRLSATNLDTTTGTGTTSSQTTQTWPEGAINCLVIEKSSQ